MILAGFVIMAKLALVLSDAKRRGMTFDEYVRWPEHESRLRWWFVVADDPTDALEAGW